MTGTPVNHKDDPVKKCCACKEVLEVGVNWKAYEKERGRYVCIACGRKKRQKPKEVRTKEQIEKDFILNAPRTKAVLDTIGGEKDESGSGAGDPAAMDFVEAMAQLNQREARFVAEYMKHGVESRAARDAGYSKSGILSHNRKVSLAVQMARKAVAFRINYSVADAMNELLEAIDFSKETENAMAYVRAVETRAKIAGHMDNREEHNQPAINFIIRGVETPRYVEGEVLENGE